MTGLDLYTLGFSLMSPMIFIAMLGGTIIGIVIGALPGLSATMAVSILLPVTYGMSPTAGIMMLLGVYCGGNYGGSIAATLVNIPGTPSAVMTTLDAYPMAKKGKAGLAIGLATMASAIGGLFSVFVLAAMSPLIAQVALKFGSLEMLAVCIFGISIMAFISQGSTLKGLMSGVIGLLIACIGFDPVTSVPRFTYDSIYLFSGVNFTASMIGLFGLTEVLSFAENGFKANESEQIAEVKNASQCFKHLPSQAGNIIRSSIVGTIVGAVPGAGGTIASIVSYAVEQKVSKHPEEMGKGSVDGIVAAEAANNACTGGAMTTMLSLGIPGDAVTAILIGAFIVHGVTPGPTMFTKNRDLVSAIFIGMFFINILILIVGMNGAPYFARLLKAPKSILNACVLLLCVVGTYGVANSMFHVKVMIVFGLLGIVFSKLGMSRAPVVLALILGPTMEKNLRRCLSIANGNFLSYFIEESAKNPIAPIIFAVTAFTLIAPLFNKKIKLSEDSVYKFSQNVKDSSKTK
ncbi:MAG: tripartite tricarboxylate transporter permease [Oscillospiraceae bacterium]